MARVTGWSRYIRYPGENIGWKSQTALKTIIKKHKNGNILVKKGLRIGGSFLERMLFCKEGLAALDFQAFVVLFPVGRRLQRHKPEFYPDLLAIHIKVELGIEPCQQKPERNFYIMPADID